MHALKAELRRSVRGEVAFDPATRAVYSTAACIYRVPPLGVVAPRDATDVLATVAICRTYGVPITPRGSGSGLAGQALGEGIVLDFTVHMNRLLEAADTHVLVQPGLIADELNAALAPRGLWFPPDPSSSGYCSIGGMIANNSAGSHSVKYGTVIDYVEELDVVLADGTTARLRPYLLDSPTWRRLVADETREAQIHRDLRLIVERHADLIRAHQPRTTKNAAGYRLERVIENGVLNLSRLVCGSEGTLALVLAARLRIEPKPAARRECLLHFPDLAAAGRATLEILPLGPSAIEVHERHAVDVIRAGRPELADVLPRPGESQLHVEFDGATDAEAAEGLARMRRRICDELRLATRCIEPASADEARRLWAIRKATLPILYNQPGPKRIISFIEDVTVPPDQIPPFIERLQAIFGRYGLEAAIYGHAAQGNFHIRPLLDLHEPAEVAKMRAVADEVFDLTIALGGTPSGEHGDGIARTEYLAKLYGPLHHLFGAVKRIFDPQNLLNPGKKVPDPRSGFSLSGPLRFDADYRSRRLDERLVWPAVGGAAAEAERCHGCATCRTLPAAVTRMCPVFKATGAEEASPRAKANLLREIAAGRLKGRAARKALARVAEQCLLCESCQADCPSQVNVPKLMLEAKARLAAEGARTPRQRLFARLDALSRLAAPFAPLVNAANRARPARWLLEKLAGLDRRAPLPPVVRRPLSRRLRHRVTRHASPITKQVIYFPDVFAELSDPAIGEALVRLLDVAGIGVIVPPVKGCGILAMCYGDATRAVETIRHNLAVLHGYARQGCDILVTEPTALLCLRQGYADFVPDVAVKEVAARTHDALDYLLSLRQRGQLKLDLREVPLALGRHVPCHARAAGIGAAVPALLADVPGLKLTALDEGCCGLAGSAGLRREKYDLGMKIGSRLFDKVRAGGFDGTVTECSACRMQLEHGTGKTCYHPLHLLAYAAFGTHLPGRASAARIPGGHAGAR